MNKRYPNFRFSMLIAVFLAMSISAFGQGGTTCGNATTLSADGAYSVSAQTSGSGDIQLCSQTATTNARWFTFTPTVSGTVTVSSCAGATTDTRLAIVSGTSCGSFACIDNDDDACSTQSSASGPVVAGTQYYIEWDSRWDTDAFSMDFSCPGCFVPLCTAPSPTLAIDDANCGAGNFDITVSLAAAADMGDADAIIITDNQGNTFNNGGAGYAFADFPVTIGSYTAGTSVMVTLDDDNVTCPFTSTALTEACACDVIPTATVSSSNKDCGAGTFDINVTIDSDGDGTMNLSDILINGAVVQADATTGTMYTFSQSVNSYTVTIEAQGGFASCTSIDYSVSESCTNLSCADAFDVIVDGAAVATSPVPNTGTDTANTSCDSFGNEDNWFSFTAPASGNLNVDIQNQVGSGTAEAGIFSGSCGSLSEVDCSSTADGWLASGLVPGQTYYLAVFFDSGSGQTYDVALTDPVPALADGVQDCGTTGDFAGGAFDLGDGDDDYGCSFASPWGHSNDLQVVFTYTAAATGNVDLSITGIANPTNSGDLMSTAVAVFDASASLPASCIDGTSTTTGENLSLQGLSVTAGTSYLIIVGAGGGSSDSGNEICATVTPSCTNRPTATVSGATPDCLAMTFDINVTVTSYGDGTAADIYVNGVLEVTNAGLGLNTINQPIGDYTITIQATGSGFPSCQSIEYNAIGDCSNYTCETALPVPTDGTAVSTYPLPTSSTSYVGSTCDASGNEETWFQFVAPSSGFVLMDVTNYTTSFETTVYAVYSGTCSGGLTEVTCGSNSGVSTGGDPFIDEPIGGLTPGETYYIEYSTGNGNGQTFDVTLTSPVGDITANTQECWDVSDLPHLFELGQTGSYDYNCSDFSSSYSGINDYQDAWVYTPTSNETIDIIVDNVTTTSGNDFAVGIFDNTVGTPVTALACATSTTDVSLTDINLIGGTSYLIIVGGQDNFGHDAQGCVTIKQQCSTTNTTSVATNDCGASTYTGRISFTSLGTVAATFDLVDDEGNNYSNINVGDYDFNYTDIGSHVVTINGYDAMSNLVCTETVTLTSGCNGGNVCADALDILGSTSNCDLSVAVNENGSNGGINPCFETVGNGTTLGMGNCNGAGCAEHSAYFYTEYKDLWYVIDLPDGVDEFSVNFTGLSCNVAVFPYTGACGSLTLMDLTGGVGTGLADSDNDGTVETEANDNPFIATDGAIHFKGADVATASTGPIYLRVFAHDGNASGTACSTADMDNCAFTIGVTSPQPNDVCGDAIDMDNVTASGNLCAANTETENTETGATCAESQDTPDLWYEVTMDGADSDQNLEVDLTFTGATDEVVVELYHNCFTSTFLECATVSSTGAGSTITHAFSSVISAGGFGPTYYVRVTAASGNTVCGFDILGRRIAENNNCEVMQNVFPGFDIDVNNNLNFNFATDSGAEPVIPGNDLWFQFDPVTGTDIFGQTTASTTAEIIIGGLEAGQELTLVLYAGEGLSANNCSDLAGNYLETLVVTGNGTVELACLDELQTSVSGGYIVRAIQTAGTTIDNGLINADPQPAGPFNNDCANIWDGSGPTNLGWTDDTPGASDGVNDGGLANNFNPYVIEPGSVNYLTGDFENATDCHPDITSAECGGVDHQALASNEDRDLWYVFQVPPTSATCDLTISTIVEEMVFNYDSGSGFRDAYFYIYDGCDDNNLVDCSPSLDGASPGTDWTATGLTQGEYYLLRIKPDDNSSTGLGNEWSFTVDINEGNPRPCNDKIEDAAELTVNTNCSSSPWYPSMDTYSALGADDEETFGQNDVFFKFTAPLPANGGDYNPTTHPTYGGQESSWVNVFLENVSGHVIQMELWNTQTIVATATQYSTSSTAGDKIWARFGNLEPGAEYEIRLTHGQTVTTDVQYKIRVEAGDHDNSVTDCDAGDISASPILCGSCGGENSTPYIADPAVSSLNSSSSNNHCEMWYKIDLPTMAGGSGTYWVVEVEGYEQILDFELRQQIATESLTHGTQEDFDHPCSSRQLSSSMGTLINSFPVTYELLNDAPTYSSIMLNGMGSNGTECTVSCSAEENISHGGGFRKVYRDILGPAAGTKNYLYLRVFMNEDDPSYIACHDGGVMINPANVLFRGPYSTDPTTGVGTVIPGTPDLPCAPLDTDEDGIADIIDLDDDNDGISDIDEAGGNDPDGDEDGDGIPNGVDTTDDGDAGDGSTTVYTDANGDGIPDIYDFDLDGIPNHLDLDADNDGIADIVEAGGVDTNNDGQVDYPTEGDPLTMVDADNDGWWDTLDDEGGTGGTNLPTPNTDGTGLANFLDIDADDDGIVDFIEGQPTVGAVTVLTADGDNNGWSGVFDGNEGGTAMPLTDTDGDDSPDYIDLDSDGDGVSDFIEAYDTDNDGIANITFANVDTDNDGLMEVYEGPTMDATNTATTNPTNDGQTADNPFPNDDAGDQSAIEPDWRDTPAIDTDGDGIADNIDLDDDNDGISDIDEAGGNDPDGDEDGDGIPNGIDTTDDGDAGDGSTTVYTDTNNDGIPDIYDHDLDGIPNHLDLDADNDGIADIVEAGGVDTNNDGQVDYPTEGDPLTMVDADNDGWWDTLDDEGGTGGTNLPTPNTDGTGLANFLDIDADDDGIVDFIEGQPTTGAQTTLAADGDNNGWSSTFDGNEGGTAMPLTNTDGDANPDYIDLDSDGDGENDDIEAYDTNDDGVVDAADDLGGVIPPYVDADNDGLMDIFEGPTMDASNTATTNPTNDGQTADNPFPNDDVGDASAIEPDWRDHGGPEYTPQFVIDGTSFAVGQSRDAIYVVDNIGVGNSTGPITVTITLPGTSAFTSVIDGTMTTANVFGGLPVNNTDWVLIPVGNLIIAQTRPGVVLNAGAQSLIGFTVTAVGVPTSTANTTLQIQSSTAGDIIVPNNFAQGTFIIN